MAGRATDEPAGHARPARDADALGSLRAATSGLARAGLALGAVLLALAIGEAWARRAFAPGRSEPLGARLSWERAGGEVRLRRYAFVEADPRLGYRLRPGRHETHFAGRAVLVEIGDDGGRRVERGARSGAPLVALGCSFTFGFGVADEQAWPARLQELLPVPVHNLGVPGYGQDQALRLYEDAGRALGPSAVVLGFVPFTEARNLADVSPFAGTAYAKPRYELEGDGLRLLDVPADGAFDPWAVDAYGRRLGPLERWRLHSALLDAWWRPDAAEARARYDELVETTARIVARFADAARAGGARPLVVFLPTRALLARQGAEAGATFAPLAALRARGVPCLNAAPALARLAAAGEMLFLEDGQHPAPAYHEEVARLVAEALADP